MMWNQNDFCDPDSGFDYIFSKMNAIYGAMFANNWRDTDPVIVRQVWKDECGQGLTYRPKMDYALRCMNPDRPPSALAFAKLLNDGPTIPEKPHTHIERQMTQAEIDEQQRRAEAARAKVKEMLKQWKVAR